MVNETCLSESVTNTAEEIKITGYDKFGRRWTGTVPLWKGKKLVEESMADFLTDELLVLKYDKRTFKKMLFERDNSTCFYCGRRRQWKYLSIDHVVPQSAGGIKSFKNCVTSCKECNGWKGSLDVEYFKKTFDFFKSIDFRCQYCLRKFEYPKLVYSVVCGEQSAACTRCDKRKTKIGHHALIQQLASKRKVEEARKKKIAKQKEKWGRG